MALSATSIEQLFGLHGRVAIVTGASSGLGIEFADALACAGADVALLARRGDRLDEVAAGLKARYGVKTIAVEVDITDREALTAAFTRTRAALGPAWVLVNNAGLAPTGRAEKQWPEDWDRTVALNMTAVFQCCLLAAMQMRAAAGGGRIINVTSIFGRLGSSLFRVASYAASKGGSENLTRQLAVEWARESITVNAIAPAWFPSEMTQESLVRESIEERMASGNPMGRIGDEGELRTACLFLASPASSYVTGSVIPVDGGYTAW
ncbi:MAG TPA: SDR family oxidoreductase [Candidatus Binatia bacterium]|jgi:gluconate 5-dehydrogenase